MTGNVQGDPISLSENIKRNVGGISIRLQLAKKLKNLRRNVGGIRAHFFTKFCPKLVWIPGS